MLISMPCLAEQQDTFPEVSNAVISVSSRIGCPALKEDKLHY